MDIAQIISSLLLLLIIGLIMGWLINEVLELNQRVSRLEENKAKEAQQEPPTGKEETHEPD